MSENAMNGRSLLLTRRGLLKAGAAAGTIAGIGPRAFAAPAQLDVTAGNIQPIPIGLPDFLGGTPPDGELGRNITAVISGNLQRSGLFAVVDPQAYIERVSN